MGVLNEPCLVLNRNWIPVTFMPVQTCITNVMRDMASVLETENYLLMSFEEWTDHHHKDTDNLEEDRWIRTPSMKIMSPEVVVLKKYGERPPRRVVFNRPNLARRDEWTCQYCGAELGERKLTIEHVLPRSRGGKTDWLNCVAACGDCNAHKADQTPNEAGMKLRSKPQKPAWIPRLALPRGRSIRPSWKPFIAKELSA
jgi:5-methylcytosine-specific restriction endonuclease McrA